MFSFAWTFMIALLPLPLLVYGLVPGRANPDDAAPEIRFPQAARLRTAFPAGASSGPRRSLWLYYTLLALAWAGLTGALMRPETVNSFTDVKSRGHDLMLAVDLSGSMQALDFSQGDQRVSRTDVIKAVVKRFVAQRQGDRVGLILFGEHAYLDAPLTQDTLAVGHMLDNAVVGEAGDSTAIGDAIGVAVQNLRGRPGKDKVLILLTDGADNASTIPPLQAAKLAAQYGIRVYTIGVGSNGPVPIPDEDGNIVMAQMDLDETLLRQIASMTGGEYFRATDTQALESIYARIDKLEKTTAESRSYMIHTPLYRWPLALTVICLMLLALRALPERMRDAVSVICISAPSTSRMRAGCGCCFLCRPSPRCT